MSHPLPLPLPLPCRNSPRPRQQARTTTRRFLLELERFEDRTLMSANTYTVNSLGDTGSGSGLLGDFRYAITQANSNAGSTINFSVTGTIRLGSALPDIGASVTISGPGPGSLAIQGGGPTSSFSVLTINGQQTVNLSGLTITGGNSNGGGGIKNSFGLLTITNSVISGNTATGGGAGGGGIYNLGTLALIDSTISGNSASFGGGGLYNSAFGMGTVSILGSTFSGNSSPSGGGGIKDESSHPMTMTNSTMTGNTSSGRGGAIANYSTAAFKLTNVTITGNRSGSGFGGGIFDWVYKTQHADTILTNSIVAGNFTGSGTTTGDVDGPFDSAGSFNLIGDGDHQTGLSNASQGNKIGSAAGGTVIDAKLAAPASNGGPTQTVALLAGSPAIDAGSNALAVDPSTGVALPFDQRENGFARVVNSTVDIGAFEVQPPPVTATKLVVTAQPPASVTVGLGFGLSVSAEDNAGTLATTFTGAVTLALGNNPGGSTLGGTITVNAVNGVATFSGVTLNQPGTAYTLVAGGSGLTSGTTAAFNVTSAAATQLVVTTQPPISVSANTAFGLVVAARDASGNMATSFNGSVAVALANNPGGDTLGGTLIVSAVNGVATFSGLTLDKLASGETLRVTAAGLTGATTAAFDVTPTLTEIPIPDRNNFPQAIATGPDGNLWYLLGLNRIAMYNPTNQTFSAEFQTASTGGLTAILSGPDGNLWFTEDISQKIATIDPTSHAVNEYAITTSNANPTGLVVGPDHNIWFTEEGANKIGVINPTTHAIAEYTIPTANSVPDQIAVGPDNNLWFTENGVSKIGVINPTTHAIVEYPLSTSNAGLIGIATGSDGNVWFTENGANKIGSINPTSHIINEFNVTQGSGIGDLIAGPDGNLYFTDEFGSRIGSINPTTDVITETPTKTANAQPIGLTVGPDGNVWFAENTGSAIGYLTLPTSRIATQLAVTTQPPGSVTAGTGFGLAVSVENALGGVIASYNGPVTIALANNPGAATLGGTVTVNASNGVATFSNLSINQVGVGYTLQATSTGLTSATTTAFNVTTPTGSGPTIFLDHGQAGYAEAGSWSSPPASYNATGYNGNSWRFAAAGDGTVTASWQSSGLPAGTYEVEASWYASSNRADNTPYRIYDGNTLVATVRVNQRLAPSGGVSAGGVPFQSLGSFAISSGTIKVVVGNDADGYVIADAVRVAPAAATPSTTILDHGQAGYTEAGSWSSPPASYNATGYNGNSWRFAAAGDGTVTASWQSSGLPAGTYEVEASWYASSNRADNTPYRIYDGNTLVATVRVNQRLAPSGGVSAGGVPFQSLGSFAISSGTIKVVVGNDADGYVIADAVRIAPGAPTTILDHGQAGYAEAGSWSSPPASYNATGYNGNSWRFAAAGDGTVTASWQSSGLPAGTYEVEASWYASSNRADNTPYRIYDGNTLVATVRVNQRLAPSGGVSAGGVPFQSLGNFAISSGTIKVVVGNDADGYVIADAVRIAPAAATPSTTILDHGQAGYTEAGSWSSPPASYNATGYNGNSWRFAAAGDGTVTASWQSSGLPAGTYEVEASWYASSNRADNTPYRIYDGNTLVATVRVNQRLAPSGGVSAGGVPFQSLGSFAISSGTIKVVVGNDADGYVIADAVRVAPVASSSTRIVAAKMSTPASSPTPVQGDGLWAFGASSTAGDPGVASNLGGAPIVLGSPFARRSVRPASAILKAWYSF